jgi:hypothetical protein
MKKKLQSFIVGFIAGCLLLTNGLAQDNQKLAQSGFQFLSVVSDARAAAMAEAMTSLEIGSSALFFNPAGMADMTSVVDVSASINEWIADIKHNSVSLAVSPFDGDYGVLGFSLQYVDYGDFYGTRVNLASPQGYDDTGIFSLNALAVGVGYAKQLTDRFSVGGQIRFVHQDLGESMNAVNIQTFNAGTDSAYRTSDTSIVSNKLSPIVFDFGTQFRTGVKSLVFGMSVRNFSAEYKYAEEGIQAPLAFTLGISMNVVDLLEKLPFEQSLYVSIDATHHRDHPEQIKFGLDYRFMNIFSLRGGYISSNDESGFSFGVGISQFGFAFDYAYTPFGVFDKVQRFTARFSLEDIL